MSEEGRDVIEEYDSKHGKPEATPDKPNISPDDEWGEKLNPVRETPNAAKNLAQVGK